MSERALGIIAVLQLLMILTIAFLIVDRTGRLRPLDTPSWSFANPVLDVSKGTRTVLQPQTGMKGATRWFISEAVTEPDVNDRPGVPYRPVAREQWQDGEFVLDQRGFAYVVLAQMGALTDEEWLVEIRPVMEQGPSGKKLQLKVVYGHTNGSTIVYVHDPERPVPGFGWHRVEQRVPEQEQAPRIQFARDVTASAPR